MTQVSDIFCSKKQLISLYVILAVDLLGATYYLSIFVNIFIHDQFYQLNVLTFMCTEYFKGFFILGNCYTI